MKDSDINKRWAKLSKEFNNKQKNSDRSMLRPLVDRLLIILTPPKRKWFELKEKK